MTFLLLTGRSGSPVLKNLGAVRLLGFLLLLVTGTIGMFEPASAQEKQDKSVPEIRVEFFGPEKGYTVGSQAVTLLCLVRNVGSGPLPENTLRLRCFAVTGLEYTSGDTRPLLPALARNQATAFRWKLASASERGPMVAAVLFEPAGDTAANRTLPSGVQTVGGPNVAGGQTVTPSVSPLTPTAVLTVIPRMEGLPRLGSLALPPLSPPKSGATADEAWLGNDRVLLRVLTSERRTPLLLLGAKEGESWRTLATGVPLVEVRGGEEGQQPWWETFRLRESRIRGDKETAALILNGTVGTHWKAEITLECRKDTGVVEGALRLLAVRPIRLYGLRLPRLLPETDSSNPAGLKADGSPLSAIQNEPTHTETARVAAWRTGSVTFGLAWPATAFTAGRWSPLPAYNTSVISPLGVEWAADTSSLIMPGATIEFRFRLFAFAGSESIRDALRFVMPEQP